MRNQYIKFFTISGNRYIYESNSNEILEVSEIVSALIDDFGVLDDKALLVKYGR